MPPFSLLPPPLLCGSNAAKSVNQWPRRTPTCQDGSYTSCGSEWLYRPNCLALCCPLLASLSYISNWPDPPKAGLKMIRLVGCRYPRNLVYSDSHAWNSFRLQRAGYWTQRPETWEFISFPSSNLGKIKSILCSCCFLSKSKWIFFPPLFVSLWCFSF